ncbi:serine/threonine protein kinase/tetratricopeptide (TPR) repeat protein [Rhodopirellula rubra]|uniref:Serine/threonine protein kinase/tetratricopeptide (TPR) repeat protein n=1 Tax=Aporhodopirellula rubra TaxID=980271 RepID=A0A7W5DVA3_9BACT|nr:protein kinase [Aporhodopirellula rubra]MBB3204718.1 serine/threonine protein kinase/tetratricopeptide (TPR) repeat protein [Aporhodopirellula rubra]
MNSANIDHDPFGEDDRREEALLDQFESQWIDGTPPDIDSFLNDNVDDVDLRERLLVELVRLDLEYRYRSSDHAIKTLREYLAEYPSITATADMIEDEWRLCQRQGELPTLEQWREDYPPTAFASPRAYAEFSQKLQGWFADLDDQPEAPAPESTPAPNQSASHEREQSGPTEDPLHTLVGSSNVSITGSGPTDSWHGLRPRFKREMLLGEGSFGVVWKAYDQQLQRHVAIKTLHPELASNLSHRDALVAEARTAAGLDHPDLMTIYDVIVDSGHVHLVMRMVDAEPMDSWWTEFCRNASNPDDRVLAGVMARISRAVHHAHLSGLIHCDLKPQNVLIDSRGNPTVLDFGLAIRRSDQETLAGKVFGTPAYMSPEQSFGETHHLDGRSDVWSLGVMLYRLITGQLPFSGSTTSHVLEAIQTRSVVPPGQLRDDIPDELAKICLRCLSKRVEDRYATAAELANELQRFADEALSSMLHSGHSIGQGRLVGCPWSEPDLVGRDDVIESAVQWLDDTNNRLLTLTGIGGIGKTQTAAVIAKRLAPRTSGDIIWVDAATAMDADQFASSVLAALGVTQQPNEPSRRRVAQTIAVRGPVTLVLDNVEQIVRTAAEQINDWLLRNPAVRLIVTSQLPLRIRGERVVTLQPLTTDKSEQASELFIRRAEAVKPGLEITAAAKEDIREICRIVDGNPLAIELAAARVGVLTIPNLRKRLSQSFGVLKSNRADRPDRHRTLSSVVRWSVDLLNQWQLSTLRALAIWPAPVPMSVAESLIASNVDDSPENVSIDDDPLDWIDELRERQLLRLRDDDETIHIHADNTVRRYILETIASETRNHTAAGMLDSLLSDPVPLSEIDARHFATNLWTAASWLIESDQSLDDARGSQCVRAILTADHLGADQLDSRLRIERIEKGLTLSSGNDRIELMVRLADAKRLAGQTDHAERLCRNLLEHFASPDATKSDEPSPSIPSPRDPRLLELEVDTRCLLAQILFRHSRGTEAVGLLEPILDSDNQAQIDDATRLEVILELIETNRRLGHLDVATELLDQGQRIADSVMGDAFSPLANRRITTAVADAIKSFIPGLTVQEGKIALQRGRIAEARNLFDQALRQQTRVEHRSDPRHLQQALLGRAAASAESGDYESAENDYDRCQRISRRLGDLPTLAQSLNNRALAADDAGDSKKCCETLNQALEIYRQLDDYVGIAICLSARAAALLQLNRIEESAEILTSSEVTQHIPPDSIHQAIVWGDLGTAYRRLGRLDEASHCLDDCIAKLDELCVGQTAERLLYEVERSLVRRDLGVQPAITAADREELSTLVDHWEKQTSTRSRVRGAIDNFTQLLSSG